MNRHPVMGLTRLAKTVAISALVTTATSALPAHAASSETPMSNKCLNAADVTDNGRDVWVLCQGLSPAWSNVVEIAVNTGKIVADIKSPSGVAEPTEIASNDAYVWIKSAMGQGTGIAQLAIPSGRLVRIILDSAVSVTQPLAIAASPGSLWIADGGEHHIVEVNASSGQSDNINASVGDSQPTAITTTSNAEWVLNMTQSATVRGEFIYSVNEYTTVGTLIRTVQLSTYNADTGRSQELLSCPSPYRQRHAACGSTLQRPKRSRSTRRTAMSTGGSRISHPSDRRMARTSYTPRETNSGLLRLHPHFTNTTPPLVV